MPPTLMTLGRRMSAAPFAMISRKPNAVDSFSPSAIGIGAARRSSARASYSSGGQIGSSNQARPEGPRHLQRLGQRPGAVGVQHDVDVRSNGLAGSLDAGDVDLMELDRHEARTRALCACGGDVGRAVVTEQAGVRGQARPAQSAEELVKGQI